MRPLFHRHALFLAALATAVLVPGLAARKGAAGAVAARRLQAAAVPLRSNPTSRSRSQGRPLRAIRASSPSASNSPTPPSTRIAPRSPSSSWPRASSGCRTRTWRTRTNPASTISPRRSISMPRTDPAGRSWPAMPTNPTGAPLPDHPGVICAPAGPSIDPKAFEALLEATQTEPPEWGYPIPDGVEMRSARKPNAPVIEKLGLTACARAARQRSAAGP